MAEIVDCCHCPNTCGSTNVHASGAVKDEYGDWYCSQKCLDAANGDINHTDCYGNPCNCEDQECGEEGCCPECGETEDIELVCSDHGARCGKCKATFCCP